MRFINFLLINLIAFYVKKSTIFYIYLILIPFDQVELNKTKSDLLIRKNKRSDRAPLFFQKITRILFVYAPPLQINSQLLRGS